ncbi:5223_t:CDS:2 [Funneliformis geosporum]|uniref:5223_t:CDS:1 n=1 Tax=Funneliformis geosporum TaxID=1117311 RepID=A0A9W4SYS9_9GLOM|nr:5223_t:CDS:2 [Funneliformis geosporum]
MTEFKKLSPIHPGEMLREEFLVPYQISPEQLAHDISVSVREIKQICQEKKGISPNIATRLAVYFDIEFSQLAGMRSDSKYSNDAGGSHNLREDCGTLGRGFEKLESLDGEKITDELTKTTSKSEFDTKKSILLQKINEITGDLQARTADQAMSPHVEDKMQECRRDLDNLRSQITGTAYK